MPDTTNACHAIAQAPKKQFPERGAMPENCDFECSSCSIADCDSRTAEGPAKLETNAQSNVKHVIGVVSGKGGVGKSLVTSLLACQMRKQGYAVGILDADVTGPSIPKAFGITGPLMADEEGIVPARSTEDIAVVSTNLMLPEADTPIAWRGPVVSNAIRQFFNEVTWGDLDYLFVDMPPGTSDVLLTVLQVLPLDGIVTVSAPQDLVAMIVGKAVNLTHEFNIPILGLVENMAYYVCDECGKQHFIFGDPQGKTVAERYDIPAYATLPLDPTFARLCDGGHIEDYALGDELDPIIDQLKNLT